MFAKAEFTNLNSTKKSLHFISGIRSGNGLAKDESIFHKILDRSKKNVGGIICGVVSQNLKILWNSGPLFC